MSPRVLYIACESDKDILWEVVPFHGILRRETPIIDRACRPAHAGPKVLYVFEKCGSYLYMVCRIYISYIRD